MAKAHVESNGNGLTFTFSTGETLVAALDALSPEIRQRLMLHGLEQKIRDAYAGAEANEAYGLAAKVWDNLCRGTWATRAVGAAKDNILVRALRAVLEEAGKPVPPNLAESVQALSKGDKIRLRRDPRIAAKLAELAPKKGSILDQIFG